MSSYNYTEQSFGTLRMPVKLFAYMTFGSTGAVTLQQWSVGISGPGSYAPASTTSVAPTSPSGTGLIASVARTGTGAYTLTLQQAFQRLLSVIPTWQNTLASTDNIILSVGIDGANTDVTIKTGGVIKFQTMVSVSNDYDVADPASGSVLVLELTLDDSSAV